MCETRDCRFLFAFFFDFRIVSQKSTVAAGFALLGNCGHMRFPQEEESGCHPPPHFLPSDSLESKHVLLPQHRLLPLLPLLHPRYKLQLRSLSSPQPKMSNKKDRGLGGGWQLGIGGKGSHLGGLAGLKASALNGQGKASQRFVLRGSQTPTRPFSLSFRRPVLAKWGAEGGFPARFARGGGLRT